MDFEFQALIHRPVGQVFGFLRDIEQHAGKPGSVVPVYDKLTPGPPAVGTQYREVVQVPPFWRVEIITEITSYQENRLLAYAFTFSGGLMTGELTYLFETRDGGTHVIQRQRVIPKGALKLFNPVIHLMFGWAASHRLKEIKELIER
jgi:hypothetical protein